MALKKSFLFFFETTPKEKPYPHKTNIICKMYIFFFWRNCGKQHIYSVVFFFFVEWCILLYYMTLTLDWKDLNFPQFFFCAFQLEKLWQQNGVIYFFCKNARCFSVCVYALWLLLENVFFLFTSLVYWSSLSFACFMYLFCFLLTCQKKKWEKVMMRRTLTVKMNLKYFLGVEMGGGQFLVNPLALRLLNMRRLRYTKWSRKYKGSNVLKTYI